MILLEAKGIKMYVKDRLLMDAGNLDIEHNDRIGLVGTNGSGKTTLLEVLAGERYPSEGTVISEATSELLPQLKQTNTTQSGGEVTQAYINQALANKADILLADEPTTNLDTAHMEKLESKLLRWQGAFVIVSHDRAFLDALCTTIWEINDGKLNKYKGNYTDYTAQKEIERRQQENAYENYVKKKQQLEQALELKEQKAKRATKVPKKVSPSEAGSKGAKPYYANKQKKLRKSVKAIETRLDQLEEVEKIKESPPIKMDLPNKETFHNRIVLRWDNVTGMIANRMLWQETNFHIKGGDKIAILGKNGSGKTTLLKKIMHEAEGVTISPAMEIGYFSQNLDVLDLNTSILENVRSTSNQDETFIRTVLARLHFFREDVYKNVQVLSGGERVKVAFAKLFVSDINTLLLDEPTNFLDIEAVEALEELLLDYEGTVLLVTHDRRFIQHIANRVLTIENQEIHVFDGTYEAYKNHVPQVEADPVEEELLLLETKISETLSKLSIEPSEALEQEFQELLRRKKALKNGSD
ncbi:Vga family ABC-F type ribosomal protection protein [Virgibacillus sp. NKC19-3]|uniref:Vga family ABC-F type ribosomal protection protein n=1 Tax=Virgibacillus saliphilus TaxID=2831674 RepID=UPI001C9B7372|nr:Vga family ABC-F type ribosomal protection protein [Virgibacillus sp. NKC19-3]MBY7142125.1 Vga family ABC-F type ribosomal protection protein [Virgibacillus sp. NKC19-3]